MDPDPWESVFSNLPFHSISDPVRCKVLQHLSHLPCLYATCLIFFLALVGTYSNNFQPHVEGPRVKEKFLVHKCPLHDVLRVECVIFSIFVN